MEEKIENNNQIKALSEDERPREKMVKLGADALSIPELLAILVRTGSREQNAVELCRHMLKDHDNDLIKLSRLSIKEMTKYKGMGRIKAITILAALELGRRRQFIEAQSEITKIKGSEDAYKTLKPFLMDLTHEEFWVIYLTRASKIIKQKRISKGGMVGTVVDVKVILKEAILENANAIIIAHNHPSGTLQPSQADRRITEQIKGAAKLIDVHLFDHLIITDTSYFSFADEELL